MRKLLKSKAKYVYLHLKMAKNSKIGAELATLLLLKTSFYTYFDLKPKENTGNDVIKQIFLFCVGFCAGTPFFRARTSLQRNLLFMNFGAELYIFVLLTFNIISTVTWRQINQIYKGKSPSNLRTKRLNLGYNPQKSIY